MSPTSFIFPSRGGMASVSTLRLLAETASEHGTGRMAFTSGQCISVPGLSPSRQQRLQQCLPGPGAEGDWVSPTSTAPVSGLGEGYPWMRESTFMDLLEGLAENRTVRVGLADPAQRCQPVLGATINFLAAAKEEQWQTIVLLPGEAAIPAPGLLRGKDVPTVARRLGAILQRRDAARFLRAGGMEDVMGSLFTRDAPGALPVLERYRTAANALTLHQPRGGWDARFIGDLCHFAAQHGVVSVGITPWRSILLPGLEETERDAVEQLCFRHRHDACANPWRQWMLASPGLEDLAAELAQRLCAACPVNPGVSIAMRYAHDGPSDTHFIVEPQPARRFRDRRFHLLASSGPNLRDVSKERIAVGLPMTEISAILLDHLNQKRADAHAIPPARSLASQGEVPLAYRCNECGADYREDLGDPVGGVGSGTKFGDLPETWGCPVCGASSKAYSALAIEGV